jgi:hypothetical protein
MHFMETYDIIYLTYVIEAPTDSVHITSHNSP